MANPNDFCIIEDASGAAVDFEFTLTSLFLK